MKNLVFVLLLLASNLYSQNNFTLEWQSPSDRIFDHIDKWEKNNTVPEIILRSLNKQTVYVYDGATKQLKYTYSDTDTSQFWTRAGFKENPIDVNNDGIFEIISYKPKYVGTTYTTNIKILNGANGQILFQDNYSGYRYPYLIDIDGDGYTEICLGDSYNNGSLVILSTTSNYVSIKNNSSLIEDYELQQNYPNPFNPSTTIEYSINKTADVQIKIYDIAGREIKSVTKGIQPVGNYKHIVTSEDLTSGTYFYQIIVAGYSDVKKMVVIK